MAYDIFHSYGLNKIHDSFTENFDYKDNDASQWELVKSKSVMDSDGFMTDYSWYTNGEKHIFMFGDTDVYEPDEDYADWVAETEEEAANWFETYKGFEDEDEVDLEFDEEELEGNGNSNFMNDGFDRVYGEGLELED
jgi:hypothetical protein